jgi:hypothetical protein
MHGWRHHAPSSPEALPIGRHNSPCYATHLTGCISLSSSESDCVKLKCTVVTFWWKGEKKPADSRPLREQSTSIGIPPLKREQGNVASQSGNEFITITHYSWTTGYCGRNILQIHFPVNRLEVEVSLTGSAPLAPRIS